MDGWGSFPTRWGALIEGGSYWERSLDARQFALVDAAGIRRIFPDRTVAAGFVAGKTGRFGELRPAPKTGWRVTFRDWPGFGSRWRG